jgi:hypothetical protein
VATPTKVATGKVATTTTKVETSTVDIKVVITLVMAAEIFSKKKVASTRPVDTPKATILSIEDSYRSALITTIFLATPAQVEWAPTKNSMNRKLRAVFPTRTSLISVASKAPIPNSSSKSK